MTNTKENIVKTYSNFAAFNQTLIERLLFPLQSRTVLSIAPRKCCKQSKGTKFLVEVLFNCLVCCCYSAPIQSNNTVILILSLPSHSTHCQTLSFKSSEKWPPLEILVLSISPRSQ